MRSSSRRCAPIDETLCRIAGGSVSGLGVGGMTTKLQAADVARRAGADVVIAAGGAGCGPARRPGEAVGTRFPALEAPLENRKRWIFGGTAPAGRIKWTRVRRALCASGRQPAAGRRRRVEGEFERGDSVCIIGPEARSCARHRPLRQRRPDADPRLPLRPDRRPAGYEYGPVAVHRNDMILV